jgi:hypothetical protein
MLTPHSTDVSGSQLLAWLESLLPTQKLDPAQEIGVRLAISELREFAEGDALEDQLESARKSERGHCENEHADTIEALEKDHADALDDARAEAREAGYELGAQDAESAIAKLLTPRGFGEQLEDVESDFEDLVYDARKRREVAEREAEREREAISLRQQLDREQAERDRLAAVRKRGAPRKPRAKKVAAK